MKFKVNSRSLCALAATIAISITPPMTLAQESHPWVPLDGFRKGINTSGVWGNSSYQWMVGPTNRRAVSPPTTPPTYYSIPIGIGYDTTNPVRNAALLDADDFSAIRFVPGSTKVLFDHVVFNLDPYVFGVTTTGAIPSNIATLTVDGHSVQQNFVGLIDDIKAAREKGLNIVLAMHSPWTTPKQMASSISENQPSFQFPLRTYPGPYRADYFTRGYLNNSRPIDQNHPLPKFWNTFIGHLISLGSTRNMVLGDDIAIRLSGEPLADYSSPGMWGNGLWPYVLGTDLAYWSPMDNPLNGQLLAQRLRYATAIATRDHRQIELEAIKAIWNNHPGAEECRILAQVGEPWPDQYGATHAWFNMGLEGTGQFNYEPYTNEEFLANEIQNPDLAWRVAYVAHIYEPFAYTHARSWSVVLNADKALQYYAGVGETFPGEDQLSWRGPWDELQPSWRYYGPMPPTGPNYKYKDYVLKKLTNPESVPGIVPLKAWRDMYDAPPMLITEFGAQDRAFSPFKNDEPMVPPNIDPGEADPTAAHRLMRGRWYYDVRNWLQRQGIGWSAWDMYDMYPTFWGSQAIRNGDGTWDLNPTDRYQWPANAPQPPSIFYPQFYYHMGDALFGERP